MEAHDATYVCRLQIALQTVDQLRLTLDSRRRTIATLEGDMTKLQTKITSAEDPRFVKLVDKKHRQEVKLARAIFPTFAQMPAETATKPYSKQAVYHARHGNHVAVHEGLDVSILVPVGYWQLRWC
jgi:hypothetical protein